MLRVLIYSDDPGVGGCFVYNKTIGSVLSSSGMSVAYATYLSVSRRALSGFENVIDIGTITDSVCSRISHSNIALPLRVFDNYKPDLILFGDSFPGANIAAKIVAKRVGIPYISFIHYVPLGHELAYTDDVRKALMESVFLITVSEQNATVLCSQLGLSQENVHTVYYGLDVCNTPVTQRQQLPHHMLELSTGDIACVTVARIEDRKGHDIILEAATALDDRLKFLWVGEDVTGYKNDLIELVKKYKLENQVFFVGFSEVVDEWLSLADLFVLTSRGEGLPLTILEAMSHGVPVIATDVGGVREAIGPDGFLLVDPEFRRARTISSLRSHFASYLRNPNPYRECGRRGRERIKSLFSLESMRRRLIDLLSQISRADERDVYCCLFGEMERVGIRGGIDIDFSIESEVIGYLCEGWSHQEEWGRWTVGERATLLFPLTSTHVEVRALAFKVSCVPRQSGEFVRASLTISGNKVGEFTFETASPQWMSFPILINESENRFISVTIEVDNPISPKAIGLSSDNRELGVAVHALKFLSDSVPFFREA